MYGVACNIIIALLLIDKYKSEKISVYKYYTVFPIKFINNPKLRAESKNNKYFHAKIYIIDDEIAFVGSLNFTYSGLHKNVETCLAIKDTKAVESLSKYFETQYNADWDIRDIEYYGKRIYKEPIIWYRHAK
jgi:phosphatidylserine/phosphatidylglycerophosphate/cardiolipin synthase-like enzyme